VRACDGQDTRPFALEPRLALSERIIDKSDFLLMILSPVKISYIVEEDCSAKDVKFEGAEICSLIAYQCICSAHHVSEVALAVIRKVGFRSADQASNLCCDELPSLNVV